MKHRKQPGTPSYHTLSARKGQPAKTTIPRVMHVPDDLARENQKRAFGLGALAGFSVSALVFALVLWLWAVPTMDAAVARTLEAASLEVAS